IRADGIDDLRAGRKMHAIAQRAFAWHVGALQFAVGFEARINGQFVAPRTNFTFQVNMSAHDLARLLAKIALGWAVASAVKPKFDSRSLVVVTDVRVGFDVVVYIQLFRPPTGWDEPPVYQVVVGRLKTS